MTSQPSWLSLTPHDQQAALLALLRQAPRSAEERAHTMLGAPPWPSNKPDAQARAATVISYLTDGYRVGDLHPTTELR